MRLTIKNLTKIIDDNIILNAINYTFESGKTYGLSGEKGSGKSVFFRCISGEEPFNKGHIRLENNDKERKIGYSNVGCVFNDSLIPDLLTGKDFIRFYLMNHGREYDNETILKYMAKINMEEAKATQYIGTYSAAGKNLLQLLCVYITKPYLALIEEPENGYDEEEFECFYNIIEELKEESIVIVSSAKEGMIENVSDEIIVIKDGELINADVDLVTLSMED